MKMVSNCNRGLWVVNITIYFNYPRLGARQNLVAVTVLLEMRGFVMNERMKALNCSFVRIEESFDRYDTVWGYLYQMIVSNERLLE